MKTVSLLLMSMFLDAQGGEQGPVFEIKNFSKKCVWVQSPQQEWKKLNKFAQQGHSVVVQKLIVSPGEYKIFPETDGVYFFQNQNAPHFIVNIGVYSPHFVLIKSNPQGGLMLAHVNG